MTTETITIFGPESGQRRTFRGTTTSVTKRVTSKASPQKWSEPKNRTEPPRLLPKKQTTVTFHS